MHKDPAAEWIRRTRCARPAAVCRLRSAYLTRAWGAASTYTAGVLAEAELAAIAADAAKRTRAIFFTMLVTIILLGTERSYANKGAASAMRSAARGDSASSEA